MVKKAFNMTVEQYVNLDKKPTAAIKISDLRGYAGVVATKNEIPEAHSAVILDGASVHSDEDVVGNVDVIENANSEEVYMKECEAAIRYALTNKYDAQKIDTEINGLSVVVTFKDLTPKSKEVFGSDPYTITIDCDPSASEKQTLKDGYFATKNMAYFINAQLNAGVKGLTEDSEGNTKNVTLRLSAKKAKAKKAETTEAADLSL